jgi:O-antigen/teichoic acid export membrane protein
MDVARQRGDLICRAILLFVLGFGRSSRRRWPVLLLAPRLSLVPVLRILLPGFLAFSVWKILAADLLARGKPLRYSLTSGIAFFVLVILDILWIPAYGIRGAALAATLGFATATAVAAALYVRSGGARWRDLFIPCAGDFALVRAHARTWLRPPRAEE